MYSTLDGIVTDVNPEPANAAGPILVTLVGIVTDVNDVQARNAFSVTLVTLLLNVIIHGDVVHRLQHPLPSLVLHVTRMLTP
jgi:hypothetical protein